MADKKAKKVITINGITYNLESEYITDYKTISKICDNAYENDKEHIDRAMKFLSEK